MFIKTDALVLAKKEEIYKYIALNKYSIAGNAWTGFWKLYKNINKQVDILISKN